MAHKRLQVREKQYDPLQLVKDLMTIPTPVLCLLLGKFSFDKLETTGENKLNFLDVPGIQIERLGLQ